MSSSVRPASATASRHASTVSDSGSTHQPAPDRRATDTGEHDPVLEAVARSAGGRGVGRCGSGIRGRRGRSRRSARTAGARRPRAARSARVTSWPMWTSSGSQPTMFVVSRTVGVLGERDDRDHVRRLERRQPLVAVDGEADDGAATRHDGRRPRPAAARRADRASAGARASRSRCSPGCGAGRRRPRSRTTRSSA